MCKYLLKNSHPVLLSHYFTPFYDFTTLQSDNYDKDLVVDILENLKSEDEAEK